MKGIEGDAQRAAARTVFQSSGGGRGILDIPTESNK